MEEKHLKTFSICLVFVLVLLLPNMKSGEAAGAGGKGKGSWRLLLNDTGVVATHMALTHENTIVMFDLNGQDISTGYRLNVSSNGTRCDFNSPFFDLSCLAHSVEYNISGNRIRPLNVQGNPWCSSGSILSNGTIIQVGGYQDGMRRVRLFDPCDDGKCDWREPRKWLTTSRCFASNLLLPDDGDRIIILGGEGAYTYEFFPKFSPADQSIDLPFLESTYQTYPRTSNLYPFLHLSPDGNLFIFSSRDSILFNYKTNRVVKTFPRMPGKGSRTFPSSASSVILPLDHANGFQKAEVMVCGGAAARAITGPMRCQFVNGLKSCGRIMISGNNKKPKWKMENMPGPRLMSDMILLPTGDVLIINGGRQGCADNAASPSLKPYLYKLKKSGGRRFSVLRGTKIARMYLSSAVLVPDGSILVAGGNHDSKLKLQAFVPGYMNPEFDHRRARNVTIYTGGKDFVRHGEEFAVQFFLPKKQSNDKNLAFSVYAPPFNTHSVSMNQRMLRLRCKTIVRNKEGYVDALLVAPPSATVAPAGYYMLSVVNEGIPSVSQWIRFMHA